MHERGEIDAGGGQLLHDGHHVAVCIVIGANSARTERSFRASGVTVPLETA